MKITCKILLIMMVYSSLSPSISNACDVSTYVAMLKAEAARLRKIPLEPNSTDIIISNNEESKYLVRGISDLFEQSNPSMRAYVVTNDTLSTKSGNNEPLTTSVDKVQITTESPFPDIQITASVQDNDYKVHWNHSQFAIRIASDDLVLIFGGSGKHKEQMKTLTFDEIVLSPTFVRGTPLNSISALALCTKKIEGLFTVKQKTKGAQSAIKLIETVVKGEADYAIMFRSLARTFTMLTKELPEPSRAQSGTDYIFSISNLSKGRKTASLWADTLLGANGYMKLKAAGFHPVRGGAIFFRE